MMRSTIRQLCRLTVLVGLMSGCASGSVGGSDEVAEATLELTNLQAGYRLGYKFTCSGPSSEDANRSFVVSGAERTQRAAVSVLFHYAPGNYDCRPDAAHGAWIERESDGLIVAESPAGVGFTLTPAGGNVSIRLEWRDVLRDNNFAQGDLSFTLEDGPNPVDTPFVGLTATPSELCILTRDPDAMFTIEGEALEDRYGTDQRCIDRPLPGSVVQSSTGHSLTVDEDSLPAP